jgi:metal-responsive CopG/Arc/MetJ family transcriptional regulator
MAENNNCATETTNVSLPKVLLARVDTVFPRLGYTSRAEYIRAAIIKQLASDEVPK